MRNTRRLATLGLSILSVGALLAGTAVAETGAGVTATDTGGTAKANALTITIAGQTITGSAAEATLTLGKLADGLGSQVLTPALTSEPAHATVTQVGVTDVKKPTACTGDELEAVPGIARFDITCGEANAALTDDGGTARGLGAQLVVEPSISGVLSTLGLEDAESNLTPVGDALDELVGALTGTPIEDLVNDANQTVQDLLEDILTLESTARIVVAPALAEVNSAANTVTSHAHAQGLRIELLPVDGAGATNNLLPDDLAAGKPLITITVGNAEVSKTVTKDGSAPAKVDATAAVVTVEFGSAILADALGVPTTITVGGGQSLCVPGLEGTPLETCITVASAGVDANGNPYADGVSIDLLKGVNGGVGVSTGRAGSGAFVGDSPALPRISEPPAELPRTGGTAVLPIAGGLLLAAALVTRRLAFGRR
jgi:hypothetical protein